MDRTDVVGGISPWNAKAITGVCDLTTLNRLGGSSIQSLMISSRYLLVIGSVIRRMPTELDFPNEAV